MRTEGAVACAATFLESPPGGLLREEELVGRVDALIACEPAVIVVTGPPAVAHRFDWAVNTSARVGCALGPTGKVSGVILPASTALAADVMEAFEADGLPVSENTTWHVSPNVRSVSWALARGEFTGTTLLLELPRTRPERARAAGAALALVMASHGLSWGLLGYGGAAEVEVERLLVAGADSVERILCAVGA